ncbi:MAG: CopG family transcriptional regulator [Actinomycetota bacterium]
MPEKITINLEPVDLGRIDVLVDQGLYSNRTDLIRTAIRNQLDRHEAVINDMIVTQSFAVGVMHVGRRDLEHRLAAGERMAVRVIGMLHISSDVDASLAGDTIESITVHGVLRAPADVKALFAR